MKAIEEIGEVSYTHKYMFSVKMLTTVTTLIIVIMGGLYVFLGLPPGLDTNYEVLYFHSIAIGIAALATYLVISVFELQKYEPPLDFPMSYRAFGAVIFAAVGGLLYLIPTLYALLPDIPLGLFVVAFILIGDVGGALFIQLLILPRKRAQTYNPNVPISHYVLRMVPTRKELHLYSEAGAGYWLALFSVGSAFVAGLMGIVNLWVMIFGPSVFSFFIPMFGDVPTFLGAWTGSHSHEIGVAIMTGMVALAAQHFKVLDLKGLKRQVASVGLWITSIGIIAISIVLVLEAIIAFAPPTLFASGPNGVNGMAGDDTVMTITALGAMIAFVPLALTKLEGKSSWKDSVRLAFLATWVAAVVNSVIEGFYIEFHEDIFGSTLSANHAVFSDVNPLFGIITLGAFAAVLLAVDYYAPAGQQRRMVGWVAVLGLVVAVIGSSMYVFVDPSVGGLSSWVYVAGVLVMGVSALLGAFAIYKTKITRVPRKDS
jgi:hypothetical protein